MRTIELADYRYQAAGQVWSIPCLHIAVLPDGSEAITEDEIQRIHTAIANEICGSEEPLTIEELDFLCDVTGTSLTEVARQLDLHKSALSKWRAIGQIPRPLYSTRLKKVFWFKLFGDRLGTEPVPLACLRDEQAFLRYAHHRALDEKLADHVKLAA